MCLQPSHEDSRSLGKKTVFRAQRAWSSRPKDLSFLIDSLDAIRKALPGWKGRFDKERIGVGGHSFGAHTAMLVGGARAYPLGALRKGRSFRDPRVRCVLLISPQGRGGLFREDSWRTMKLPALVITGSEDRSPLDRSKRPDWRLDPFRLAPPADKYLLWIEGAHHGFGGISGVRWRGAGPRDPRQVQLVREVSLDFFDAYLRGDAQARRRLERGARVRASKLEARLEIRHPAAPAR